MQRRQRVLGTGQRRAIHQLARAVVHPDFGIGIERIEEALQREQLIPRRLGHGHADGVIHAVAVEVSLSEGLRRSNQLVHGGGNGQVQLFQPVRANPHQVGNHQRFANHGQRVKLTVEGDRVKGRSAGFQHDALGLLGCVLVVDFVQRHNQTRLIQLLGLQSGHVHELRNGADGQLRSQLLVVFVAALHDPVVFHVDVQLVAEQIAPEVVGHGLVRMLREVVRVERVVRGTNEMHRHGFIIFLFVRQRAGAEHHERHQQRYDGEEFLHREASFAIVEPNSYRFY